MTQRRIRWRRRFGLRSKGRVPRFPAPFVNANLTFSDSLTIRWGDNTLKLIHMAQKGHSAGDVIVWVPEKRLMVTGDLVVGPTPYATYFNTPGMVKALQALIAMEPAIIIPGHGVVQYDVSYLRLLERAFREYRQASEAALAAGIPLKEAVATIAFPEIDQQFTHGDELLTWAYRSFFSRNLIIRTYRPKDGED
jgi:cyclase